MARSPFVAILVLDHDAGETMTGTLICRPHRRRGKRRRARARRGARRARLGLRFVLAHAVDGIASDGEDNESLTTKFGRLGAERRLARLAADHGVSRAERRIAVGDAAALIGQIAAEEAADVIVVPAASRGWRRRLDSRLAGKLNAQTPVPVLIAPPRRTRKQTDGNGGWP